MARDWEDVQIGMAKLAALVRETRDRPLSEEEAAELSVAIEAAIDVQVELQKQHPSMKRIRKQVYETLSRFGRDEPEPDEP
jgi:hypothetical protein